MPLPLAIHLPSSQLEITFLSLSFHFAFDPTPGYAVLRVSLSLSLSLSLWLSVLLRRKMERKKCKRKTLTIDLSFFLPLSPTLASLHSKPASNGLFDQLTLPSVDTKNIWTRCPTTHRTVFFPSHYHCMRWRSHLHKLQLASRQLRWTHLDLQLSRARVVSSPSLFTLCTASPSSVICVSSNQLF